MDFGTDIAIALPLAVLIVAFYARPVSRVEVARLVQMANESESATKLVAKILDRRYISFWELEQLSKLVNSMISRDFVDGVLGDARTQAGISRASGKQTPREH